MTDAPTAPHRLLIVEDDPVFLRILRAHVQRLGGDDAEVAHAGRLGEGLRLLEQGPVDLVLLDLTLPDSSPETTLANIGRFTAGGAAVLVLSALDDADTAAAARAAGAVDFMDKGAVSPERLRAALEKARAGGSTPSSTQAAPAAAPTPAVDSPERLASQLVHDARSWLTNHSFRLAALRRSGSPEVVAQLQGLEDTAQALGELLEGGRALVKDATSSADCAPVDLGAWFAGRSQRAAEDGRGPLSAAGPGDAGVQVLASEAGLEVVFDALFRNAREAAGGADVAVELRVLGATGAGVDLEFSDDGGSWSVEDPERLADPFRKGERGSVRAGLGLYRARRWMERMGGGLELVPRADVEGAVAVRLRFRSA